MAQARVAIVTTANPAIGSGHLQRCLTLSDALRAHGARCGLFVYAGDPATCVWAAGRTDEQVVSAGMGLDEALERAFAWSSLLVIDTYDVEQRQLSALLEKGAKVLVVDDLADRKLPATWILNTCFSEGSPRYRGLTNAVLLLGPAYALIRAAFAHAGTREAPARAQRILVMFGGSDPLHQTARVLRLLRAMPGPLEVTVIVGLLADETSARGGLTDFPHASRCLRDVRNVEEHMAWADLAISGAGQTLFELAATGCPAIALRVADNQRWTADLLATIGSVETMDARVIADDMLKRAIGALLDDASRRKRMSAAGRAAVDGLGAGRVADVLLGHA